MYISHSILNWDNYNWFFFLWICYKQKLNLRWTDAQGQPARASLKCLTWNATKVLGWLKYRILFCWYKKTQLCTLICSINKMETDRFSSHDLNRESKLYVLRWSAWQITKKDRVGGYREKHRESFGQDHCSMSYSWWSSLNIFISY